MTIQRIPAFVLASLLAFPGLAIAEGDLSTEESKAQKDCKFPR